MNWDNLYRVLGSVVLIIILLGGACCSLFTKPSFCFGFLAGAIIMLANFHIMQKSIQKLFMKEGFFIGNAGSIVSKYYFRLAIIGIIIYILLGSKVDPVGLILGLSTLIWGILVIGIYYGIKFNKEDRKDQ